MDCPKHCLSADVSRGIAGRARRGHGRSMVTAALFLGVFSNGLIVRAADEVDDKVDAARRQQDAAQRLLVRQAQVQEEELFRIWELQLANNGGVRLGDRLVALVEELTSDRGPSRQLAVRFLDRLLFRRNEPEFGGEDFDPIQPARHRLNLGLRHKVTALELLCGLSDAQRQKLMLAGKKDIVRLLEPVEERRRRWEAVGDRDVERRLGELQSDAREMKQALDRETFGADSHFARMVARLLTSGQTALCRSMGGLDRLTTRVHLLSQKADVDEVGRLRLDSTAFGDADMPRLAPLASLRGLFLDSTRVTDAGLAHLALLPNLDVLDLGSTRVTGVGFAQLGGLSSLQVLYLGNTLFNDAGLENLRKLPNLKKIDLQNTPLTGSGLVHLTSLSNLETLFLGRTQVRDDDLAGVQRLENLKELDLDDTQISDAGLIHVAGLPNLFKLDLRRTRITDAGLEHLKRSANLRYLYLYGTPVSDEAVARFQQENPAVKVLK